MELKANSSRKKLSGAYYTPDPLAHIMVKALAHELPSGISVLEPSCGDGVFIDSLADFMPDASITAVEIDAGEAEKARSRHLGNEHISVLSQDFFDFYESHKDKSRYDLIVGNPPYIRYQYLTPEQRKIQSEILTSNNMKSNRLINAWVAFLVACVQFLKDDGTIAFIIPAEILQVAYAEDLRIYLANELSHITMLTFKELVFPEIEQEVLIFIGRKGKQPAGVRIIEVKDVNELAALNLESIPFQPISLDSGKWTQYFVNAEEMALLEKIRSSEQFTEFSSYGLINVGITTGNNRYFSIDEDMLKKYQLENATLPLIGRSSHAHGVFFTDSDWKRNIAEKKRAFLIRFPDIPFDEYPEGYRQYIKFGEESGENTGYKCSIRDRWYIVPSVWVPDAFFLRRNNLYPKFVLNRCGAVSTDTMHRMKFNDGINGENVLLSYYNSISFAFTEICGRSYGGGVLEILPGEMGKIMLPKIADLDKGLKDDLLSYVDKVVRSNDDIERALDYVDKHLLIDVLGIDPEWCRKCRAIWRKLQARRLTRGDK